MSRKPVRMETRNCEFCGTPFTIPHWEPKRFCNKKCSDSMSWRKRHGMSLTPEYIAWRDILRRCEYTKDKAYHMYGARGIKVCERWHVFENFLEDMGLRPDPSLSLDRIDNDWHYEPGNCRWATKKQQSNNRRGCWKPSQDDELRVGLAAGMNFSEIARQIGKSQGSVAARARRLGLKTTFDPHAPRGPKRLAA